MRNRPSLRFLISAAAIAVALAIGGCDSGSESDDEKRTDDDKVTPAGAELDLGETAKVSLDGGLVAVTVRDIEPAPEGDLDGLEGFDPTKQDLFYVHYETEVESEKGAGIDPSALLADVRGQYGSEVADAYLETDLANCTYPPEFLKGVAAGDTFDLCTVQIAPKGETIDGATFTHIGSAYDIVDGEPIVWQ